MWQRPTSAIVIGSRHRLLVGGGASSSSSFFAVEQPAAQWRQHQANPSSPPVLQRNKYENNNSNNYILSQWCQYRYYHQSTPMSLSSSAVSSWISPSPTTVPLIHDGEIIHHNDPPSTTEPTHHLEPDYLNMILNAKVYDIAIETELQYASHISTALGFGTNTILLKREDTQPIFSFKIRGAYNKMASLSPDALRRGVVACSAGNHAQGVALSARILNCRAVICMPCTTPAIKVNAVRKHAGGLDNTNTNVEVRLVGNTYDEAAFEAQRLAKEEGLALIHPFDDPLVIAGQGTIATEILKKCVSSNLDAIFVCCGGGGMLAGIATYVKHVRPGVKVYGVEASDAAGMTTSLETGRVVTLPHVGLFADGAAVKTIGNETFRLCQKYVDGMITVNTDQICNAIKLAYNDA